MAPIAAFNTPLTLVSSHLAAVPSTRCITPPRMVQTPSRPNQAHIETSAPQEQRSAKRKAPPGPPTIVVLGLTHHTATVDVRERLAVPEDEWAAAAAQLCRLEPISEAAVLSTCNRFELYMVTTSPYAALQAAVAHLAERSGIAASALRQQLFMQLGGDAVWHGLRVAAGLESMIVGEGQILSQVKKCYEVATAADGSAGKVLARMLNAAVSAGKRVRAETGISKGSVSMSSAAVELAALYAPRGIGAPLEEARIAVLGAGKMSRLLVKHLVARGVRGIVVVNRTRPRAEELAEMYPDAALRVETMEGVQQVLADAQVAFAATGSTEPVVTKDMLLSARDASPSHPLMLLDISVPRNVSADATEAPLVHSYNVDDLKAVVAENQARRQRLTDDAERVLHEERATFDNWLSSLGCVPCISKLQQRAEEIRVDELERARGKLAGLSPLEQKAVEALTKGIIKKMLHCPMAHLRSLDDVHERTQTLRNVEALFSL